MFPFTQSTAVSLSTCCKLRAPYVNVTWSGQIYKHTPQLHTLRTLHQTIIVSFSFILSSGLFVLIFHCPAFVSSQFTQPVCKIVKLLVNIEFATYSLKGQWKKDLFINIYLSNQWVITQISVVITYVRICVCRPKHMQEDMWEQKFNKIS